MTIEYHPAGDKIYADQTEKLLQLLKKAQSLGLTFYIGNAYISREYINQQTALNAEIDAAIKELTPCI
jgi:hypothetical protein